MRYVCPENARSLLVALCAAALLPACVADPDPDPHPDPADPGAGVAAEMMAAMQRDLGLTEDDVLERLRAEARAARLEPMVRERAGDAFAGAWMSEDGRELHVGITDPDLAGAVLDAGAVPVTVEHSLAELGTARAALDAGAATVDGGIHAWYVDVATNTVVVHAEDPNGAAVAAFVADQDPYVRVVASPERPRPLYDVRGGDEIILGGTVLCSVGFSVHGGYVTAGHCGSPGTPTYGSNWVAQGEVIGSTFPTRDYAWVQTNGSWTTLASVNDYAGGTVPVAGSTVATVGSSVCRSGRTTGWRCGVVQARDVTINYADGPVYGATRTSACAEGGDSGGAFLSGDQAQGVTSGGSGNCTTGGTTFFQPVNPILSHYGLSLKTTGGNDGREIVSSFNGKCIDVPYSNFADGVKLHMWGCNGTAAQQWTFTGGTVRAGGKCMDVAWADTTSGTRIQIANCSGHPAQQFVLSPTGDLVSVLANKCVDIAGWNDADGAELIIWDCHGGANQKWFLR